MNLPYVLYCIYIYTLWAYLGCYLCWLIVLILLVSLFCMYLIYTICVHLSYYEPTIITSLLFYWKALMFSIACLWWEFEYHVFTFLDIICILCSTLITFAIILHKNNYLIRYYHMETTQWVGLVQRYFLTLTVLLSNDGHVHSNMAAINFYHLHFQFLLLIYTQLYTVFILIWFIYIYWIFRKYYLLILLVLSVVFKDLSVKGVSDNLWVSRCGFGFDSWQFSCYLEYIMEYLLEYSSYYISGTLYQSFLSWIYGNITDSDFQTSGLLFIVFQMSYSAWNIIWNYFHLGK